MTEFVVLRGRTKSSGTLTPEQKRIERAYQRAMNIRDSTPGTDEHAEQVYSSAYIRCFRYSNEEGFRTQTRMYLRAVRKAGQRETAN